MIDPKLVGSVLYDCPDPMATAQQLEGWILSGDVSQREARAAGIEPRLLEVLRRRLPNDPAVLHEVCLAGAAWVLGRRSVPIPDSWDLVVSLPHGMPLPSGVVRTTGETLNLLIGQAQRSVRLSTPYMDSTGLGHLADALALATTRGALVEVFRPVDWAASWSAVDYLRERIGQAGRPSLLSIRDVAPDSFWGHLKVVTVDDSMAYIGSANLTRAGLGGQNLELGVLVVGPKVAAIAAVLALQRIG